MMDGTALDDAGKRLARMEHAARSRHKAMRAGAAAAHDALNDLVRSLRRKRKQARGKARRSIGDAYLEAVRLRAVAAQAIGVLDHLEG